MFVNMYCFQTCDTTGYTHSGGIPPNMSKDVPEGTRFVVCQYPEFKIRGVTWLIGSRQAPLDTVRNEDTLEMLHGWQLLNCNIL